MAAFPPHHEPRVRLVRIVLIVAVVIALGVAALWAAWSRGLVGEGPGVRAEDLARVLIVAAAPDEDGAVVAQVITLVDVSQGRAQTTFVSPATPVSIPGTSYDTLADAYPFGGGAGVAEAYARATGITAPAYVALAPDALMRAVDAADGVTLELPADMAVFDGETLYVFAPGSRTFSAEELGAVLKGAAYLTAQERSALDAELGRAVCALLGQWPDEGGLMRAAERADMTTTLSPAALDRLVGALAQVK